MAVDLPITGIVTIILRAFKYGFSFSRYNYLKGYYYVCSQQERKFINSPEEIPNFLKIEISWLSPGTLKVVSKDFDRTNLHQWKIWTSEIAMNGHAGTGRYIYDIGNETGIHEVVLHSKDKLIVRVIDTGKADWKKGKDNEPASQVWVRVNDNDPMLKRFEQILP